MSKITLTLSEGFLVGASTAAHQIEGNNTSSDWWELESSPNPFLKEPSGDAADSYHRWPEDMDLLAEAGLDTYRFSVEWARIEPVEGRFSHAARAHYRRMIEGALARGLKPVVTLHHFTSPAWFTARGGWKAPDSDGLFALYVGFVAPILEGVAHIVTINEPNVLAMMFAAYEKQVHDDFDHAKRPDPLDDVTEGLIRAHRRIVPILKEQIPAASVGWSVASQNFQALSGGEEAAAKLQWEREDRYLEVGREDDFIGIQAYTRVLVGPDGPVQVAADTETTIKGWEYYPAALELAVRHAGEVCPGLPVLVTENGIATSDDARRIDYTRDALRGLASVMAEGVTVLGYLHWSALDNYEWGDFEPTFGLIEVDRTTFERRPRPSLAWLGAISRARQLPGPASTHLDPTD